MIFVNFKLIIYGCYILSSVNSHLPTAIRSIWFKVLSKDFQALTCSLFSVNILFLCPSLSCHICSAVYPLTFLLEGKVCLKHAWSDLLFSALVLDMIRSQCCNIKSKKYSAFKALWSGRISIFCEALDIQMDQSVWWGQNAKFSFPHF